MVLSRYRDRDAETPGRRPAWPVTRSWPRACVLGAGLIGYAAVVGLPHWQSVPSTWDAVWHANEIRYILDTGQASPTHMGELRNVETHAVLYYPSAFHATGRRAQPAHRRRGDHRVHASARWRRPSGCSR